MEENNQSMRSGRGGGIVWRVRAIHVSGVSGSKQFSRQEAIVC